MEAMTPTNPTPIQISREMKVLILNVLRANHIDTNDAQSIYKVLVDNGLVTGKYTLPDSDLIKIIERL
jgi:hypothetical protein